MFASFSLSMSIRVALIGVGNCAKSLLEGLSFYSSDPSPDVGLMHPLIGGLKVSDIEVVAAFDIDERKVGKPLFSAAQSEPNNTLELAPMSRSSVIVERGPTMDSVIVVEGTLKIYFRDREIELNPGEFVIVPRGVEHKPESENVASVMLCEPKATTHTGDVKCNLTVEKLEWI